MRLKFEFDIICMCHKILFFWLFFNHLKCKTILSSQAVQKYALGWLWCTDTSLLKGLLQGLTAVLCILYILVVMKVLWEIWRPVVIPHHLPLPFH